MPAEARTAQDQEVAIPVGEVTVAGSLSVPSRASGVVVFAHGSGSGRFSARNRAVARVLLEAGFATLLIDLLTPTEEAEDLRTARLRFDVGLLGERVICAIDWLSGEEGGLLPSGLGNLPVGCFGASTGAAAALIAAAERPSRVRAVVSRGGRPDLVIVPGAGHLFEEPGALEQVAGLTRDWFLRHLVDGDHPGGR
jgi:pimeloyl-ACP methyl ester carboxylesterase